MDLSVSLFIAASFAILCTFYIGKRILTVDFSEYSSENSKKAKLERLLAKKDTPLQNSKIRKDIRNAFERILIPLGKADKDLLPANKSTDLTGISFAEKFTLRMLFPSLKMTLKHGAMTAENGVNRF
mgnify:CR=1 FL=1